ncbi:MAG: hypothetical protein ACSHYA_02100 [Opitutaceae bacterium]
MSEDKRPKLRLSRDLQPTEEANDASVDASASTSQGDSVKASLAKGETTQKKEAPAEMPPPAKVEAESISEPKQKLRMANAGHHDAEKTPRTAPTPPTVTPAPAKEPATTPEAPPPLPSAADAPPIEPEKAKKAESNIVVSVVIIAVLFLGLGLIVFAILLLLRSSPEEATDSPPEVVITQQDDTTAEPEPTTPESTESEPTIPESTETPKNSINPIDRAKETIAKVPVMEAIPDISNGSPTSNNVVSEPQEQPNTVTTAKSTPLTLAEELPQVLVKPQTTELQEQVTQYLSSIHIDGVRTGSKPKVMIDALSYNIGTVLDEATGLSFEGVRDGKLLFKDRNGILYLKSF